MGAPLRSAPSANKLDGAVSAAWKKWGSFYFFYFVTFAAPKCALRQGIRHSSRLHASDQAQ